MLMTNHRYARIHFASMRDRRGVYQRGREQGEGEGTGKGEGEGERKGKGEGEGKGEGGNSKKYFRVHRPPSPCFAPLRKLH